jgi:hypothetical protein
MDMQTLMLDFEPATTQTTGTRNRTPTPADKYRVMNLNRIMSEQKTHVARIAIINHVASNWEKFQIVSAQALIDTFYIGQHTAKMCAWEIAKKRGQMREYAKQAFEWLRCQRAARRFERYHHQMEITLPPNCQRAVKEFFRAHR